MVILLVWLWLTNIALLFGAELNAVIELRRAPELPETLRGSAAARQERANAYRGAPRGAPRASVHADGERHVQHCRRGELRRSSIAETEYAAVVATGTLSPRAKRRTGRAHALAARAAVVPSTRAASPGEEDAAGTGPRGRSVRAASAGAHRRLVAYEHSARRPGQSPHSSRCGAR